MPENTTTLPRELLLDTPEDRLSNIGALAALMPAYPSGVKWEGEVVGLIYDLTTTPLNEESIRGHWARLESARPSWAGSIAAALEER